MTSKPSTILSLTRQNLPLNNVFSNLAFYTQAASRNIAPFDFRNSTFTFVEGDTWRSNYYDGVVYFPLTVAIISGNFLNNATGNWTLYFNSVPSVSSSSYLRNDQSGFTVKYCFPYELLDTASSATNWSSHTSQMIGYGTGYAVGTTLPQYARTSGVAISWYTDIAMTTPITVSTSATDVYYCSLGSTRVVWFVDTPTLIDGAVSISDGTSTYSYTIVIKGDITLERFELELFRNNSPMKKEFKKEEKQNKLPIIDNEEKLSNVDKFFAKYGINKK